MSVSTKVTVLDYCHNGLTECLGIYSSREIAVRYILVDILEKFGLDYIDSDEINDRYLITECEVITE